MARETLSDYSAALARLMPAGALWTMRPASVAFRLLEAMAVEFYRVAERASVLLLESDPRRANELLPDWERVTGSPPPCVPEPESTHDRRMLVAAQLAAQGGARPQYFIDLAASLGYTVTIREFHPFVAGPAYGDDRSKAGDAIYNDSAGWHHVWVVQVEDEYTVRRFEASRSVAGDPLATWGNWELECLLVEHKPAHTLVLMTYGDHEEGQQFQPTSVPQSYT